MDIDRKIPLDLAQAIEIVCDLQDWLQGKHYANLNWSYATLSISIDDVCLWDDQGCSSESLNIEFCKQSWRDHVGSLCESIPIMPTTDGLKKAKKC